MGSKRRQLTRSWPWWAIALVGQLAVVFAAAALTGPGRIDIVDGQTRYEAGRSLVDHGDWIIRDSEAWFGVFPGRAAQPYTNYRFPQTLAAAGAILVSDATGPLSEARRHFFFTLTSAAACAVLAVTYALWFIHLGHAAPAAFFWASAGIFCTPSWFYGTSTFDDILGTAAVVLAVVLAFVTRRRAALFGAAAAGLLLGLAFNCKQPLGIYVLAVLAAGYLPTTLTLPHQRRGLGWGGWVQWPRMALIVGGLFLGIAVYKGFDLYKFPPGTTAGHGELMKKYAPLWTANPAPALLGMSLSPAAGALWYCPTLLLSVYGLLRWYGAEKWLCRSLVAASGIFVLFLSTLTIWKGDPAWGPRYLTPVFGLLWLFVPAGAKNFRFSIADFRWPQIENRRSKIGNSSKCLLAAGLLVQVCGLSVDPHRLYIERGLPSAFYVPLPWLYFHPAAAHLLNRPREIIEVLSPGRERAAAFTPAPASRPPTFAFPVIDFVDRGPPAVRKYHVLNSLRPWWISQQYLPPGQRPVDLVRTLTLLALALVGGLMVMLGACRALVTRSGRKRVGHAGMPRQRVAAAGQPGQLQTPK